MKTNIGGLMIDLCRQAGLGNEFYGGIFNSLVKGGQATTAVFSQTHQVEIS
jgi:hypothetical protein